MTLGQRIQELRKAMGLSQEALGEALGVSRQAVSKWEGDNGIPELDKLIAMSRLFGVTVGELLGVETPAQPVEETPGREEERLEAVLKSYLQQAAPKPWRKWLPAAALAAAFVLGVLLFQIHSLRTTVKYLRGEVSSLQVQVSNNLSNLSGQIRNSVYAVLEEQNNLVNRFDCQAESFDPDAQTVTIGLSVSMKEYLAGSQVQFCADWVTVEERTGQTTGEWVDGPDFADTLTLPMNYHTEISIRVRDAQGNIKEQLVDTLYQFHPESFRLEGHNLTAVLAIAGRYGSTTYTTAKGPDPHVKIYSTYPDLFQPETARITVEVNGEIILAEDMAVGKTANDDGAFPATIENGYLDLTLQEGDRVTVRLDMTDDLGRRFSATEGGAIKKGYLEHAPMAAPVVWD